MHARLAQAVLPLLLALRSLCNCKGIHPQILSRSPSADNGTLHRFVTRPDIAVPRWNLTIHNESALSPGYWFVAPYHSLQQAADHKWIGPQIFDGRGQLIWSGAPMFNYRNGFDFRAVEVDGQQMASLIIHEDEAAFIIDNTYELHATVEMVSEDISPRIRHVLEDQKKTNFHDFSVIEDGSRALMLTRSYENSTIEESRLVDYIGNCTAKWEGFKEIDLNTRETMFEWNAHGRIGLNESTWSLQNLTKECSREFPDGWGVTHLNSLDKFLDGDYLVSARHTDAVYKISHADNSIVWRLGGVRSDFVLPDDTVTMFSRQHHARVQSQNTTHTVLSLFDNAHSGDVNDTPSNSQSRGLIIALHTDTTPMIASVVQEFTHPNTLVVPKRGSMQILPNGNTFICWSIATSLTEHASDGTLLMEATFDWDAADSYRGYKFPWIGQLSAPPDVSAIVSRRGDDTCTVVHVSWNGATEVANWNVYRTEANGDPAQLVASALKSGFETSILFDGSADYVFVEGLDIEGSVLGRSNVCEVISLSPPPAPLIRKNTTVAFLVGFIGGPLTILAIWQLRWRNDKKARYGLLTESDDEEDTDIEDEDLAGGESALYLDNMDLIDLPPGLHLDENSLPSDREIESGQKE